MQLALKQRNRFIHNFYGESFGRLTNPREHQRVIEEVVGLRDLFRTADDMIEPLSYRLMLNAGMTEEQISQYAYRTMGSQVQESKEA